MVCFKPVRNVINCDIPYLSFSNFLALLEVISHQIDTKRNFHASNIKNNFPNEVINDRVMR